jgi:3-hydroxyisobutyrate dehydrogenase
VAGPRELVTWINRSGSGQPGFATALMNKDLGLAMDAVESSRSAAPLGSLAADIYAKFATTHRDRDFSAVIERLRGAPERR